MKSLWQGAVGALSCLIFAPQPATPQAYTISAKPGVVNYLEGSTELNGQSLAANKAGKVLLSEGDTLSTRTGKAEVLLTPGAFVRLGADSSVKMVSPQLIKTVVELTSGEAYVEISQLSKENDIEILDSGVTTVIKKPGLYRFHAGADATVSVLEGKVSVAQGNRQIEIGRNRELALNGGEKPGKFDSKQIQSDDNLYAWSKVRDQYVAAASFSSARGLSGRDSWGAGMGSAFSSAGWYWNSGFNSWAWLPGTGAFFSPFGYGYFAPDTVGYAPIIYAPVTGRTAAVAVPVNPSNHAATTTSTGQRAPVVTTSGARYPSAVGFPRSTGSMSAPAGSPNASSAGAARGAGQVGASRSGSVGMGAGGGMRSSAPSGGGMSRAPASPRGR